MLHIYGCVAPQYERRKTIVSIPRPEHPRPQWKRDSWQNLNGTWDFAFDWGVSGEERHLYEEGDYPLKINVPFCPESKLSGIEHTDFIPAVWYRRSIDLSLQADKRYLLHFGAVDYEMKLWVNGSLAGSHRGGYASFSFDITDQLNDGENTLVVFAKDDVRSPLQATGKQSDTFASRSTSYTRTTGIWQTVWLETVPQHHLKYARMTPQAKDSKIFIELETSQGTDHQHVRITAYYNEENMGEVKASLNNHSASCCLELSEKHLWQPGDPHLYDLTFELLGKNDEILDSVESYAALRDISWDPLGLRINGEAVFMRLILDQGFFPEGIYTAPSDEDLKRDIELSMSLGFNGARFHQRVFEERSLYWADKLGYIVWGEYANTFELGDFEAVKQFIPEWLEVMKRDYNHPSIIGWCPLNETYHADALDPETHTLLYQVTKLADPHRPVIDASGGMHYRTDFYDVHDYEQQADRLKASLEPMLNDAMNFHSPIERYLGNAPRRSLYYNGEPYWVSEYGGTFWSTDDNKAGWGYGDAPQTEEAFVKRYVDLTRVLLEHPRVCGFCYTQLTDIEQEQNGLFAYDRSRKFAPDVYEQIRAVNEEQASYEKNSAAYD